MSLKEDKRKILIHLWKAPCSLKPKEISKRLKFKFPSLMMHLVGLKRMGYVNCPEKGYYTITGTGKEVLGFPPLTQQLATTLLSPIPIEKAFYFFTGIGNYSGISANSLEDFCEKIETTDNRSVKFHMLRGDFEKWFDGIGDKELARKISLLHGQNLTGEQLRKAIYEMVKNRFEEIKTILT